MKPKKNIDATFIKAYLSGDDKALNHLVKRWHKLFCDKAYWMVRDKDVAKDIAQESWIVIINKLTELKDTTQFKYWAYRIVINKSTDWLRKQSKKQNKIAKNLIGIEGDNYEYDEKEHLKIALAKAINTLPQNQTAVIKLFYLQDYSLKQIASLLNISVGTAKSRLFYAREKLKTTLKHINYEN